MGTKQYKLQRKTFDRCERHAQVALQWHKDHPSPLTLPGIMKNPHRWRNSKVCECCFAIYCGLDPDEPGVIVWAYDSQNMKPYDFIRNVTKVDVKCTHYGLPYLYWPMSKNKLRKPFLEREMDVLVHGRAEEDECSLVGWIGKHEFFDRKLIATGSDATKLFADTWYVPEAWTHSMDVFAGDVGEDQGHFVHWCWCGRWASLGSNVFLKPVDGERWHCREHAE